MQDRELLELAANAAGVRLHVWGAKGAENFADADTGARWNPLTDDGDALRLAVKMHFVIDTGVISASVHANNGERDIGYESHGDDPCAATRRAIVRAAAEVGKQANAGG